MRDSEGKRVAAAFGGWAALTTIAAIVLYLRRKTFVELGVLLSGATAVAAWVATVSVARRGFGGEPGPMRDNLGPHAGVIVSGFLCVSAALWLLYLLTLHQD
jgi:hypothetical protein